MGCWLGKAVGGTLGMPFEGHDGPLDLHFYEPVPTEMLPNDDLDLQVVWACVLNAMDEPRVDRHVLAQAWREHVHFPWDEYGVALRNMALGLQPPLTGSYDNWFAHGMGATIRSEVWACLAPGNPQLAAAYAYEDACFDHAGEGIHGETFFAALESMAFVESDPDRLLDAALATLPADSFIRRAVQSTRQWWRETRDWRQVRELILRDYGHENFTDCTMNVAFTVLGWLASEGDFSRAICIAVNCGKDTDCTGATVGALMGIMDPDGIPEKWLAPIGRDLVLSPGIVGLNPPRSLDEFTELVLQLRARLAGQAPRPRDVPQSASHLKVKAFVSFLSSMPSAVPSIRENARLVEFDGSVATWPEADFEKEYLLVSYPFHLKEAGGACVMFNTREACRVWLDGEFLFDRPGGSLAPSFHRAPQHQRTNVTLSAGEHWLTAVVRRPRSGSAQWICGIGSAVNYQWLPEAIHLVSAVPGGFQGLNSYQGG
jgi:ADP-ribosylglycohydrolase